MYKPNIISQQIVTIQDSLLSGPKSYNNNHSRAMVLWISKCTKCLPKDNDIHRRYFYRNGILMASYSRTHNV